MRLRLHEAGTKLWCGEREGLDGARIHPVYLSGSWQEDLDYKLNHFTTRSASIMPPIR
jgi:hypothetical protein